MIMCVLQFTIKLAQNCLILQDIHPKRVNSAYYCVINGRTNHHNGLIFQLK